ncbi:hypothetical protein R5R35_014295 [Gryllus longicercus]|uniref:Uncharacterized protein n=1 Tax=Gryllus longicercus TaxID=2509291 RepID=A0AAN9VVR6_9ORTH
MLEIDFSEPDKAEGEELDLHLSPKINHLEKLRSEEERRSKPVATATRESTRRGVERGVLDGGDVCIRGGGEMAGS